MKRKDIVTLKEKSKDELFVLLKEQYANILRFRTDVAAGKVNEITKLKETKKTVARILTFLKQKDQS